ncbi:MAG: hypothetical protein HYU80_01405 [Candidatus Blackburnbacteria bacterium]|nr:hypothetical protein [Candidatus Blackburnbacteria bacterium]
MTIETTSQDNREARRLNAAMDRRTTPASAKLLELIHQQRHQAETAWHEMIRRPGISLAQLIYQTEPVVPAMVEKMRSFSQSLAQAKGVRQPPEEQPRQRWAKYLNGLSKEDYYSLKVGGIKGLGREGTSLSDIETMSLPLSLEDINRINRIYRHNLLFRANSQETFIAQSGLVLAAQPWARPDLKQAIPATIRPLFDRLTNYWDYHTNLIANPVFDTGEEAKLATMVGWLGKGFFKSLALFIPARLGITPASTMKLFEYHSAFSGLDLTWKMITDLLGPELVQAYRPDNLPPDLQPYQQYAPEADKKTSQVLGRYYQNQAASELVSHLDSWQSFLRLGLYWKALRTDILTSGSNRLEFRLPDHPVFNEVILTCQNKQVLIFILSLALDQTHLTLEIDNQGRLFGLPADLVWESPSAGHYLIQDILSPILEWARNLHPQIEPSPLVATTAPSKKTQPALVQSSVNQVEAVPRSSVVKRRRLPLPAPFQEPDLPLPVRPVRQQLTVIYSRSQVRELLGPKTPEKVVTQIMGAIKQLEYGSRKLESVKALPGCYKFRSGNYRVIVRPEDGQVYFLVNIGYRRNIYDF